MVLNVMGKTKYGKRTGNARQSRSRRVAVILQRADNLTFSTLLIMQRCTEDLKELRETISGNTFQEKAVTSAKGLRPGFPWHREGTTYGPAGLEWSKRRQMGDYSVRSLPVCFWVGEKRVPVEHWEQWTPQSSLCFKRIIRAADERSMLRMEKWKQGFNSDV